LPEVFEFHTATGKPAGSLVRKTDMRLDEPVAQPAVPGAVIFGEVGEARPAGAGY
jgi:hypothetical protein